VISHRLIPIICCLLVIISYCIPITDDNAEAQVSNNRIESIESHADILTSAQINVYDRPNIIDAQPYRDNIYVANSLSNTVSESIQLRIL
jgi:hypothetical protein